MLEGGPRFRVGLVIFFHAEGISIAGGQENLSQGLIRELPFRYPKDPNEQAAVVGCLFELDARIAAETEKLAALKTHKRGLMQQLFPIAEDVNAWPQVCLGE